MSPLGSFKIDLNPTNFFAKKGIPSPTSFPFLQDSSKNVDTSAENFKLSCS